MEILINDYPVDFKLEGESTLPEIITSISGWAGERGLIFTDVIINDNIYSIDKIEGIDFGRIEMINCVIESRYNLIFSTVDEGVYYCSRVVEFISSLSGDGARFDQNDVNNIISGIEWLVEVLNKVALLMELNIHEFRYRDEKYSEFIERLKTSGSLLSGSETGEAVMYLKANAALFQELKELFRMIHMSGEMKNLILKSIDSPDILLQSLHSLAGELPKVIKDIEEAAISFQSGRDSAAAEKMNYFIDFMLRYTRTCYQVVPVFGVNPADISVDGLTLEDKNASIMELLNEVIESMENNDIVSLADILEYEIMPVTQGLDSYIGNLISHVEKK